MRNCASGYVMESHWKQTMGKQASTIILAYKNVSLESCMSCTVQKEDSAELQSSCLWMWSKIETLTLCCTLINYNYWGSGLGNFFAEPGSYNHICSYFHAILQWITHVPRSIVLTDCTTLHHVAQMYLYVIFSDTG